MDQESISSYAVIREPHFPELFLIIDVPAIENERLLQELFYFLEIRCPKFAPFGHNGKRISISQHFIVVITEVDPLPKDLTRLVHRYRIMNLDFCTGSQETVDDD